MYVALDFSELDSRSLYISSLLTGPFGGILMHRRMINPNCTERYHVRRRDLRLSTKCGRHTARQDLVLLGITLTLTC